MTQGVEVSLYGEVKGSGPDMVVLHPAGLDHTFMGRFIDDAAHSYRVLAIDLCGHGRSPDAPEDMTLAHQAAWVNEAMQRHGMKTATVLGLSLGGMVAQTLALDFPASVARLIVCGCTGGFVPSLQPLLLERGLAARAGGMEAVVDPTLLRWFTPAFLHHEDVMAVRQGLLQNHPENWVATWRAISGFNALPRLHEIRVPTLVVAGDQDVATPLVATETLTSSILGARRAVLQGAPHMMQIETHSLFSWEVLRFMAETTQC